MVDLLFKVVCTLMVFVVPVAVAGPMTVDYPRVQKALFWAGGTLVGTALVLVSMVFLISVWSAK